MPEVTNHPMFWIGLIYVTFPLNLLVYGWNDIVDRKADAFNRRKGNFLFGALGSEEELRSLPRVIVISQLVFYALFAVVAGWQMLVLLVVLLATLYLYNHPTRGWRSRPPLELSCQIGYLLIVPFSTWLNDAHALSPWAFAYLALFALQSHLMGEVMDIEPDRKAGKRTTATVIGRIRTKLLIIALVTIEIGLIALIFQDWIFGGMLIVGWLWLWIDVLLVFRATDYTLFQMKLFGYGSNALAASSIAYVWWSGCLLTA